MTAQNALKWFSIFELGLALVLTLERSWKIRVFPWDVTVLSKFIIIIIIIINGPATIATLQLSMKETTRDESLVILNNRLFICLSHKHFLAMQLVLVILSPASLSQSPPKCSSLDRSAKFLFWSRIQKYILQWLEKNYRRAERLPSKCWYLSEIEVRLSMSLCWDWGFLLLCQLRCKSQLPPRFPFHRLNLSPSLKIEKTY